MPDHLPAAVKIGLLLDSRPHLLAAVAYGIPLEVVARVRATHGWPSAGRTRAAAAMLALDDVDGPDDDPDDPPFLVEIVELDEAAIRRRIDGCLVPLTRGERIEAVRRLTLAGYSERQIADRLHIHQRQVCRDRAAARSTREVSVA